MTMKNSVRQIVLKEFSLTTLLSLTMLFPANLSGREYNLIPTDVISASILIQLPKGTERSVADYVQFSSLIEKENIGYPSKSEPGYTLIPDSVYELSNLGYKLEQMHWYYLCDEFYRTDTVIRYFYNELNEFLNITETRSYYPDGNLKRLVRREPYIDPFQFPPPGPEDIVIIDSYIEEYYYTNSNLSWRFTARNEYGYSDTTIAFYTYDTEGRLTIDSTIFNNGSSYMKSEYYYNSQSALEYIFTNGEYQYSLIKYTYEVIDTARITHESRQFWEFPVGDIFFDTVNVWQDSTSYYETFNTEGRRESLMVSEWHRALPQLSGLQFKALYDYTESGDIRHATYYRWEELNEENPWKEATRIEYTYIEAGKLLSYEKTFYDDRFESWEIENSKSYYYSLVPVAQLEEKYVPIQLTLFPNPAKEAVTIQVELSEDFWYVIINLNGSIVGGGKLEERSISVSELEPGLYIVKLYSQQSVFTGKFIKN
jgi:hypothetical protein